MILWITMKKIPHDFTSLLRKHGYKATPGRIAILVILEKNSRPLSVPEIDKQLKSKVDQVTIYRTLEAFTESGIVRKIDLQHPHAHYEIVLGHDHHHHIVCKKCGKVEDIELYKTETFEKDALKKSKLFSAIKNHSLEFFGICNTCTKTV